MVSHWLCSQALGAPLDFFGRQAPAGMAAMVGAQRRAGAERVSAELLLVDPGSVGRMRHVDDDGNVRAQRETRQNPRERQRAGNAAARSDPLGVV